MELTLADKKPPYLCERHVTDRNAQSAAASTALAAAGEAERLGRPLPHDDEYASESESQMHREWQELEGQSILLRDIFGNPFRRVAIDPRWLTSSVLDLARAIYDDRAFERMPVLADALMDAGCDNDDILDHCRGDGVHVRGCWVVDLLLGKE
jgi:hypothetical protein